MPLKAACPGGGGGGGLFFPLLYVCVTNMATVLTLMSNVEWRMNAGGVDQEEGYFLRKG